MSSSRESGDTRSLLLPMVVLLVSIGACATVPPPMSDPMPPAAAACNAEGGRFAIGKSPTPDVVEQVRVQTGSSVVRVLHPGQVVTMDYRADRLNLDVNDRGAITGVRCG